MCVLSGSVLSDYETPESVELQASLSMGFPREEYWSRLPFPPPEDLPDPGIKLESPASPALAGGATYKNPVQAPQKNPLNNPG